MDQQAQKKRAVNSSANSNRVGPNVALAAENLPRLLYQLQERQLELELRNLELREATLPAAASPEERAEIFNSTPISLVSLDADGLIRDINHAGAALIGAERTELIGKKILDFVAPQDVEKFRASWNQCRATKQKLSVEIQLQSQSRRVINAQLLCFPPNDWNARPGRVALADVTQLKAAEKKILRLAAFPAFNPNPVIELEDDGAISWFNEAAQLLTTLSGRKHPREILPVETAEFVRDCLAKNQSRIRHETVIGDRHLFWSFFPVASSRIVHCYGSDITERLQLESQLHQSQKMESVGQLAAAVAHDFNNILMIIQGYTSLLLAQREVSPEISDPLKQISSASERATNLTRQLMTFSRKQIIQPKAVDLREVINNAADLLRRVAGENIAQQFNFSPSLPLIQADPAMMEQLIMNLTINARDAMPKGGTLTIATTAVEIDADYVRRNPEARVGHFVCVSISDTGVGMDSETLEKIFDPFFTTKEEGTGLGLSTVYGIVKQHQGWIEVRSQTGQGSTFKIFLPAAGKPPTMEQAEEPTSLGGSETILVVEDEPALRELVVRQLRKAGYKIIQARSGTEALAIWPQRAREIDLLFTDMVMPDGMTGRDLAETLLAQKPELKIIYTSGYSIDVVEEDFALRKGANFLQKPYQATTLLKVVRASLDKNKVPA